MTALSVLAWMVVANCAPVNPSVRASRWNAAAEDAHMFPKVLAFILDDSVGGSPRIDPRPLRADPAVVTLRRINELPDRFNPDAQEHALETADSAALLRRLEALTVRGIATTDATSDIECPGAMGLRTPERLAQLEELCPNPGYKSLIIALPREGAAYWPGNLDKRAEYRGRIIASVRVIQASIGRFGSTAVTYDLVFERRKRGDWQHIDTEALLVVE